MKNYQSKKRNARLAGVVFLTVIICGIFAEFYIRKGIFVSGDPIATAQNIKSSQWLFRLGIVSDLVMNTAFFFFPLVLYKVFRDVNKDMARIMVFCVMISVAIYCINMFNQVAALLLTSGADYLKAFEQDQLNGLVTFFLKMHTNGYYIAQIFFGLYLFPLGYLVYKSGFMPKVIGVFLILGCLGDMIDFFKYFLFPEYQSVILENITIPADLGEFSLCLWLLIVGVKNTTSPEDKTEEVLVGEVA